MEYDILISAPDCSGSIYAKHIIYYIYKYISKDLKIFKVLHSCVGEETNIKLPDHTLGLLDTFKNIFNWLKVIKQVKKQKYKVAILIDSPDFHFRLIDDLKRDGTFIIYYILPKFWAWNKERKLKFLRKVDRLVSILPFEIELLKSEGFNNVYYFGNPLVDLVKLPKKVEKVDEFLLLPGSRKGEVKRHLNFLKDEIDLFTIVLPKQFSIEEPIYEQANKLIIEDGNERRAYYTRFFRALAKTGTISLELALLGIPHVGFYIPDWLSYHVGKILVKTKFFTLPNLILDKPLIPEFIGDFSKQDLLYTLDNLNWQEQLEGFERLHEKLKNKYGTVLENTCWEVSNWIRKRLKM